MRRSRAESKNQCACFQGNAFVNVGALILRLRATASHCAQNDNAALSRTRNPQPATRNPQPATRNPQPATRNPQPATRNPQPATRNPQPATHDPRPATRNPQPATRNPRPATRDPQLPMNSLIQMAILGCGGMSGAHARRYKDNPAVQIVALCDVKPEIVEAYIARNLPDVSPKPKIYTDPARMYGENSLDAVTIVTPHTMHFKHGMQAIEAGLNVFMEKPMVTDSADAHALKEAVEASDRILVVGYNSSCTPQLQWLREAIRTNKFGKLETVTGWLSQSWAKGTAGSWRQDPSLSGGGQMYDSGAHIFNSLVWSVEAPIERVFAFSDNLGTPVDINSVVAIKFRNGVLATMTINGNSASSAAGMVYNFEDARVEVDGWGGNWARLYDKGYGSKELEIELQGKAQTPNDNFIDALLGRAAPLTSPQNGINHSELMDAIYQSIETGEAAEPVTR